MTIATLSQKACFITGAASGIGRATALAAAKEGAVLFLTDVQAEALERVVEEVEKAGGRVAAHRALDISSHEAVRAFAEHIHTRHGSMDVLMNIAGISIWGPIDALQHRHFRSVVEVNLMGPIHVLECFVPKMIEAGRGGHIVNVSSAAGLFGLPWHVAYSASKFGLRGVSEVLRFDLEKHGIGVSLVCPGGVKTPLVGTVQIVGVDMNSPHAQALKTRFERHAVSPEHAARAILRGITHNRYLVFTSNDIRFGYFLQQKLPFAYAWVMRGLNKQLQKLRDDAPPVLREESPQHVRS